MNAREEQLVAGERGLIVAYLRRVAIQYERGHTLKAAAKADILREVARAVDGGAHFSIRPLDASGTGEGEKR